MNRKSKDKTTEDSQATEAGAVELEEGALDDVSGGAAFAKYDGIDGESFAKYDGVDGESSYKLVTDVSPLGRTPKIRPRR